MVKRLCVSLLGLLLLASVAQAALKVKVEVIDQYPTTDHRAILQLKVTLYMPSDVIEEYGLSVELDADAATTPANALTFMRNHAITFAANRGLTVVANEVFIFGGPQ